MGDWADKRTQSPAADAGKNSTIAGSNKTMKPESNKVSRRSLMQMSGAGATAFTIIKPELVRGAGNERLKAGLVGCGGRGTQAATQLLTGSENVELVAMGDIFEDRLEKSLATIRDGAKFPDTQSKAKVDHEHHFVGFDAYQKSL